MPPHRRPFLINDGEINSRNLESVRALVAWLDANSADYSPVRRCGPLSPV